MSKEARALYADMGATPVINALGPRTLLGDRPPTRISSPPWN